VAEVQNVILHDYPFPIAKCYERVVGARDEHQRWDACRYLFEVTLKYLSCIGIAQYLQGDMDEENINGALACLTRPSLGHWLNILRLVNSQNQDRERSLLPPDLMIKSRENIRMAAAINVIKELSDARGSKVEAVSPFFFLENMVSYRNRTAGHGAPQPEHIKSITPILESAIIEFLEKFDFFRQNALVFISEIRVERQSIIHSLYKLMGTTKVALPNLVTGKEDALFGSDKTLFICGPDNLVPLLSLHPLVIFANEDLYMLNHADPLQTVEYVCHHSGLTYTADRVFDDFREKMGAFFGHVLPESLIAKEQAYKAALMVSLLDGIIQDDERAVLDNLILQFGIPQARAQQLELAALKASPDPTTGATAQARMDAPNLWPAPVENGQEVGMPRRLLFFPYASMSQGFWADLTGRLVSSCQRKGYIFSMLAPEPGKDHDAAGMTALLSSLEQITASLKPDLLVMAPPPSAGFLDAFSLWYSGRRIPLMTVATEFHDYRIFKSMEVARPPMVRVDDALGGRMAAEILSRTIEPGIERPQVLVLPGLDLAPSSLLRVKGFRERFAELHPSGRCKVLHHADLHREKAIRVLEGFFEDADPFRYHGLFCCNDEMALGSYEALLRMADSTSAPLRIPIVGFDHSQEMAQALRNDRSGMLAGTIDQNLPVYIEKLLEMADAIVSGSKSAESQVLVQPIAVPKG